jgi:microcystin degradation protein MlrC
MDQAEAILPEAMTKPVILADVADNPGGGGSGDTPELLKEMIRRNLPKTAAALIWDPETVETAFKVGVGNKRPFISAVKPSQPMESPLS